MPRAILCSIALVFVLSVAQAAEVARVQLAPGVEFAQQVVEPPAGPLVVNVVRAELGARGVAVREELARDVMVTDDPTLGREAVGRLAARHGALVGINGGYFDRSGVPIGLAIRDGELLREGMANRVAMGLTADGRIVFDTLLVLGSLTAGDGATVPLDGINRPLRPGEIVLLTPAFGERTRVTTAATTVTLSRVGLPVKVGEEIGGVASAPEAGFPEQPIPADGAVLVASGAGGDWLRAHVRAGEGVRFRFDLVSNPLPAGPPDRGRLASRAATLRSRLPQSVWTDVRQAISGGPWLVRDGKPAVDADQEGFHNEFVNGLHPRTAVGATADGKLLIVTVDGRQPASRGVTLAQMAQVMRDLGAVNAINLDGGSSTTMVVRGLYVNSPSDGEPAAIADALLLFGEAPAVPDTETLLDGGPVRAGEAAAIKLPDTATGQPLWGTLAAGAFVDQHGVFRAAKAGTATAVALTTGGKVTVRVTVTPGPVSRLRAALGPTTPEAPDRHVLTVRALDALGNPVPGARISVRPKGGAADATELTTDATGRAQAELVWDVETGRKVAVTCPDKPGLAVAVTAR